MIYLENSLFYLGDIKFHALCFLCCYAAYMQHSLLPKQTRLVDLYSGMKLLIRFHFIDQTFQFA